MGGPHASIHISLLSSLSLSFTILYTPCDRRSSCSFSPNMVHADTHKAKFVGNAQKAISTSRRQFVPSTNYGIEIVPKSHPRNDYLRPRFPSTGPFPADSDREDSTWALSHSNRSLLLSPHKHHGIVWISTLCLQLFVPGHPLLTKHRQCWDTGNDPPTKNWALCPVTTQFARQCIE